MHKKVKKKQKPMGHDISWQHGEDRIQKYQRLPRLIQVYNFGLAKTRFREASFNLRAEHILTYTNYFSGALISHCEIIN